MIRRGIAVAVGTMMCVALLADAGDRAQAATVSPRTTVAPVKPGSLPVPEGTRLTLAQLKANQLHRSIGPTASTDGAKAAISGWVASGKYTTPKLSITNPSMLVAIDGAQVDGSVPGPALIGPNTWWKPTTWNWRTILGTTWDAIWNKCLGGALKGVVGYGSGAVITKLLIRGAKVFIGPEGYAALAIGSCAANVVG